MKEVFAQSWTRRFKRDRSPWLNRSFGSVDVNKRIITIDPKRNRRLGDMLDTIVHEETHAVYPEFNEREVVGWAGTILANLTQEQVDNYLTIYDLSFDKEKKRVRRKIILTPVQQPVLETAA